MHMVLFTNNPLVGDLYAAIAAPADKSAYFGPLHKSLQLSHLTAYEKLCLLCEGPALGVLHAARDAIHAGWQLKHHPLYGNYRPNQQPYRSLLLSAPKTYTLSGVDSSQTATTDTDSLHFIEEALLVYASSPCLSPEDAPAVLARDCSFLDYALMQNTLEQHGFSTPALDWMYKKFSPAAGQQLT